MNSAPIGEICSTALNGREPVCLHAGTAKGLLAGGNLSLIATTLGTPFEVNTDGKILFLEDRGEQPYRIDRLLQQLKLAGKFRKVSGVLLGDFVDCGPDEV